MEIWNAFTPYLARQMSRVATQTPGMENTPFLVRRGRENTLQTTAPITNTRVLPRFGPL